jgi:uracil phosphoribosyltransferase
MSIEQPKQFPNFYLMTHPLIQHKISLLRDKNTCKKEFKELAYEITLLSAYEATKTLPLTNKTVQTPLETCQAPVLSGKKPVIVPILRAGIGMVDALLTLMPSARVGHIGLYRDENTHQPHRYYFKIPKQSEQRHFFVCDPMLATGGSAAAAITELKKSGIKEITFICLVAAPEGVKHLHQAHPDVPIYAASLDRELNENCYILPGLGDAGDRLFGTV